MFVLVLFNFWKWMNKSTGRRWHFQSMVWIFFISMWGARVITATRCAIYIHCMFLSGHISLRRGAEKAGRGGGAIMCIMHLLLSECSLTSSHLSGSRLKLNQKWTGKIFWSAKRYPADQKMVASFLPPYHFSWRVNRTTARDREGRLAADAPDWKVMNSVKCENTFSFVENNSRAVIFMKNRARLPQFLHVFHSLRHHKLVFSLRSIFPLYIALHQERNYENT